MPGVETPMKLYKIRDKKTGLFSKGGSHPIWGPQGKVWVSKRALMAHFAILPWGQDHRDWEVLEYPVGEPTTMSIREFMEKDA